MPQNLTDYKSTLVQVMAWCCQATSHYMSQCWPKSILPYGVTGPHWVNWALSLLPWYLTFNPNQYETNISPVYWNWKATVVTVLAQSQQLTVVSNDLFILQVITKSKVSHYKTVANGCSFTTITQPESIMPTSRVCKMDDPATAGRILLCGDNEEKWREIQIDEGMGARMLRESIMLGDGNTQTLVYEIKHQTYLEDMYTFNAVLHTKQRRKQIHA